MVPDNSTLVCALCTGDLAKEGSFFLLFDLQLCKEWWYFALLQAQR